MSFINTIPKTEATGLIQELYTTAEGDLGYIPNYLKLFSHRPEVYQAWTGLISAIRKNMRLRRYELVTLAAARQLECTYCMLAHGYILLKNEEVDEAQLAAIAHDYHASQLPPDEVAIMEFAEKVITKASGVTQADVDHLKSFGLSDVEILDITLAATARSFFSKTLDALHAVPDAKYLGLDPMLREALAVGRPFGDAEQS